MAGALKLLGGRLQPTNSLIFNLIKCNIGNVNKNALRITYSSLARSPIWQPPPEPTQFRHLNPNKYSSKLLQASINKYDLGYPRTFFFRRKDNEPRKPNKRVPKIILAQNPFKWLMIKIDLGVLKSVWDPTFEENDFKFGTKQAISRVTQIISEGQYCELNGLLTKPAREILIQDLNTNWPDPQRALVALSTEDIQISSPRKVYFVRIADKRYCDIDMVFLALRWIPINSIDSLVFTEIGARFRREYTPHCIPEWTIAFFKILKFKVMRTR